MITFDQELKIWDATTEADFDGWRLEYAENLNVDRDDRAYLITVSRGQERRKVYVARQLGQVLHVRFIAALHEEYIQSVARRELLP